MLTRRDSNVNLQDCVACKGTDVKVFSEPERTDTARRPCALRTAWTVRTRSPTRGLSNCAAAATKSIANIPAGFEVSTATSRTTTAQLRLSTQCQPNFTAQHRFRPTGQHTTFAFYPPDLRIRFTPRQAIRGSVAWQSGGSWVRVPSPPRKHSSHFGTRHLHVWMCQRANGPSGDRSSHRARFGGGATTGRSRSPVRKARRFKAQGGGEIVSSRALTPQIAQSRW